MLFDPARHEALQPIAWDEGRARAMIKRIVGDAEQRFSPESYWPTHPLDSKEPAPFHALYFGACGVIWALRYLESQGAVTLARDYVPHVAPLLALNRVSMEHTDGTPFGSYLMGDTGIRLLQYWCHASEPTATALAELIGANMHHPARELMMGSPGTLLAAGRHLLDADDWTRWRQCIANTMRRTEEVEGELVNWRGQLDTARGGPKLMQYCHGAPGFVICLGDFPDASIDALLEGGAEATWAAGPLAKGSNLCHGTGGNGYAFLKLFKRTGDRRWIDRARAFAMHGIVQTEAAEQAYGQMRYSLWTGDPGFAIYLWDCIRGSDRFPTVDTFFG